MKKILSNLINSFTTDKDGYSARKLSAFAAVCVAIYVTVKLIPVAVQIDALYAWLIFAGVCLGIVTIEQIINLKNGSKQNKDNEQATV